MTKTYNNMMTKEQAIDYVNSHCDITEEIWHTENHHNGYNETVEGMSKEKIINLINKIFDYAKS